MSFIRRHRNDIALIAALLIFAAAAWVFMLAARRDGASAVITSHGQEISRLPLSRDTTLTVGGDGHENTVVVENGRVYVSQASCPDHVCIRQGPISYDGQTIVCLPNRLVITVTGSGGGVDAAVQ